MTARLLKYQRDIPTGLLAWFIKLWKDFTAYPLLNRKELGILIILVLERGWSTLSEIERRGRGFGLTEAEILVIIDKLIRRRLAECRWPHNQHSSLGSGSIAIAEYRATV